MVVVLKGMNILIDGVIRNRYVYCRSEHDHYGIIRIWKGYRQVIKSADPLTYQWVWTDWNEIGDELVTMLKEGER